MRRAEYFAEIYWALRNNLGFSKGTCVPLQHLTLVAIYPQYLDIGLDDDTANEVRGPRISVYGIGKVHKF